MSSSNVWDTLIGIQHLLEDSFGKTGVEIQEPGMDRFNQSNWINRVWTSDQYRRAHIDVVDARDTKGIWMMHCCIFPHTHNPAPIYGFDVIAGRNKITGCFHDFSPAGDADHPLIHWFANESSKLNWDRTRELPSWAKRIFTPHMVAASNVKSQLELDQIIELVNITTSVYLQRVAETNHTVNDTTEFQNYYAHNQKQNPHTPRVMASLGLHEHDVAVFINKCLFPEIH